MKSTSTISALFLLLTLAFPFNSQAQDIDYRLEGCIPSLNGPTPGPTPGPALASLDQDQLKANRETLEPDFSTVTPPLSQNDLNKIWKEMESLMLNMIDLEVEVLDLRSEQLKVVPFSKLKPQGAMTDEEYQDIEDEFSNDQETDQLKYEMLQMGRHLNSLIYEVRCIRDEIEVVSPYSEQQTINPGQQTLNSEQETLTPHSPLTVSIDYYQHRLNPIKYASKPAMQVEDPIERFWMEMEEMAIQAMDLEVEISDLRIDLSHLKRNSWELDQVALQRSNPHNR